MEKKFSKIEAIKFGWQTMKQNFWFFIGLLIVAGLVSIVPDAIADSLGEERPGLALAIGVIGGILGIIAALGLIKISLNFCDNVKSKILDIFSQYRLFFKFLFASILYGLIVLAGLILLIIPGIYLAIRFQFYRYFIVDKRSRITESLKRSWQITQGSVWNLFLLDIIVVLINLAGVAVFLVGVFVTTSITIPINLAVVAVFLVGLFVTIPTTIVAIAFVYRKLLGTKVEAASVPTAPAVPRGPMSPMTPPPAPPPPPPPPPAQPPMVPPSGPSTP